MYLVHDANGSRIQIWAVRDDYGHGPVWEFHVHGLTRSGDPRVCPSLAMACELARTDPRPILDIGPFLSERREPIPMTKRAKAEPKTEASAPIEARTDAKTKTQIPRAGTKQATLIAMLRAPEGATIEEITAALQWAPHTVRGMFAGTLKKRFGREVISEKVENRGRVYKLPAA
jgi:hypothetical protein